MDIQADAWVEMYKDFTVPPQSGSGQNQTKMATFNVRIEYHGMAVSTMPYWPARYKMFLMLDQIPSGPGPALHLEKRELEDETVRASFKVVHGIPLPIPDVDLATQKNPVYFNAPVIPGRTYRLTLRVEVVASGSPVRGTVAGLLEGSTVNFMDRAMAISKKKRVDGYIKWGPVRLIINP